MGQQRHNSRPSRSSPLASLDREHSDILSSDMLSNDTHAVNEADSILPHSHKTHRKSSLGKHQTRSVDNDRNSSQENHQLPRNSHHHHNHHHRHHSHRLSLLSNSSTHSDGEVAEEEEEFEEEDDDDDESYTSNSESDDLTEDAGIPPQLMEKLSKFSLFKNAPISFHKAIAGRLKLMQHHAQEYIVKFGEPAKAMYWILRGSVAVTSPDGEAVHAELVAGQFFGEIGILFNRPRTATVIARTKVLLGVLTVDNFNAVLPDFPAVERMIRDEAQERLSMQDKRKRNGVTNIMPKASSTLSSDKNLIGTAASNMANAVSTLPGPSLPPKISFNNTPTTVPSSSSLSTPPILRLESISQSILLDNSRFGLPQVHDNVDSSIPTRDFLRSLPMFTLLPSNIIHELVLGVEPKRYETFEYIVRKGETGRDIFFIVNGEVEVLHPVKRHSNDESNKLDKDQHVDRVIARLGTGQYFGEMAFLQSLSKDNNKKIERSADIRSVTTVDVLVVSGDQLENLYSRYPRICDEMEETATKRSNRNKDTEEEEEEEEAEAEDVAFKENPFDKWKGFGPKNSSLISNPIIKRAGSPPIFTPTTLSNPTPNPNPLSLLSNNDVESNNEIKLKRSTSPFSTTSEQSSVLSQPLFKDSFSSSMTATTSISSASSANDMTNFKFPFKRKRAISIASISPLDPKNSGPLNLNLPPMNPVLPSMNNFPSQQRLPSFQYMNHAKRLRLASISGRRRSSVLSTGSIPDRLLLKVFEFLKLPELMKLRIICRRWRQLLYVAPGFFEKLDLQPYNTSIDDKALIQITDFVGSRPKYIDISDCFHVTDVGFCYMVNEIGMSGQIKIVKMRSVWDVSAMAIMDLAVPSIGHHIEFLDLSNCRKVRDDVIERIIGWKKKDKNLALPHHSPYLNGNSLEDPIPGMEDFDDHDSAQHSVGCTNLKHLNLSYCKHLTDRSMYHIALHASERLQSLDIKRCTTITDAGFAFWAYQPFPNLRRLKLGDCTFLTDKSIVAIASSAQLLEYLDLSFCCALTDVSIEVLCLGCPNLRHLDLSFCGSAVSDSSLLAISIHLRNLESLVIKGCVRVTRAGVDALLSSSIPLKYLDISQCRNAHTYKNNTPAAEIKPIPGSKSAFVTTTHENVVQIVI